MHDLPTHQGTVVDKDPNAFPLTAIDRQILSMTDQEYQLTSWDELSDIISSNRLEQLKRKPSDLRRYIAWSTDIKAKYGGITDFVVKERLHWEPLPSPSGCGDGPPTFAFENQTPFADSRDFAILRNDWPYGLAEDITHLCVWTKTPIATDDDTGDVTPESRRLIEDFVKQTFAAPLDALHGEGKGKGGTAVLWFKNWVALQSVRGVDHIHVMLRNVPKHIVDDWTM